MSKRYLEDLKTSFRRWQVDIEQTLCTVCHGVNAAPPAPSYYVR